jgi:hypothetical protein
MKARRGGAPRSAAALASWSTAHCRHRDAANGPHLHGRAARPGRRCARPPAPGAGRGLPELVVEGCGDHDVTQE